MRLRRHRTNNGLPNGLTPLDESDLAALEDLLLVERIRRLERSEKVTLKERLRITLLQRSQLRSVLALVLFVCIGAYFVVKHLDKNSNAIKASNVKIEHAQALAVKALAKSERRHKALREYQIAACKRANEGRAETNRARRDDYLFDITLANGLELILTQPSTPNPNLTPAQARADLDFFTGLIGKLRSFASEREWRLLIPNCETAVDRPSTYHAPPPVKFSVRKPPPSALAIMLGKNLDE